MASRWFRVGVSGAKICVATRPIRSGIRKRSKERIARVRHRYLDSAIDGDDLPPESVHGMIRQVS